MANRTFVNEGFWERIDIAIKLSGMSKAQIAEQMGVNRKALMPTPSDNGTNRSWHSGRLAAFCKITGVSSDWLLGLSNQVQTGVPKSKNIQFFVLDKRTGKAPIYDGNHLFREKWFKQSNLMCCDLAEWVISEDGELWLTDDCGNIGYPPQGRFEIVLI